MTQKHLYTPALKCNETKTGCVVLMSLFATQAAPQYHSKIFTISASSYFNPLSDGSHIINTLVQGEIDYYSFYVPASDEEAILTVISLDNELDPNLIVKKGLSTPPTLDDYDQKSNASMTDIMILNKQILKLDDVSGYYIVGVYSEDTKGKYQISFTAGNYQFYQVSMGHYYEFILMNQQVVYLLYYHNSAESFKVLLNNEYGTERAYIESNVNPDEIFSLMDSRNSSFAESATWTDVALAQDYYMAINKEDKYFCAHCFYMIKLTSPDHSCRLQFILAQ